MLTGFIVTSMFFGLFMSFIWSSNGFTNVIIKTAFSAYTVWAVLMVVAVLGPMISVSGMKLF